ncbi:MAG: glycogen-binding domain-containing protein [Elusimicrobiota bacterium]|nr:glycogen-binding domain-containing protein [Elusimicrobiota bacterium]
MKSNLNTIKLLIFVNIIIFIISLSIIYFRYSHISSIKKIPDNLSKDETVNEEQAKIDELTSSFTTTTVATSELMTKSTENIVAEERPLEERLRRPKFIYFSSKAKKVELVGDFSGWVPQKMKKVSSNRWELTIEIPEGKYLYNFLVDGKIVLDPNNKKPPELSPQGFKSSVLELK